MAEPHKTPELLHAELIAASRDLGHPVATLSTPQRFEAAWVGRYSVDEQLQYVEVYAVDRTAGDEQQRFWPTVRTERLHANSSTGDCLDQRLTEFVQDVLREDRIDDATMARVGEQSERIAAAAVTVPRVMSIDGRVVDGIGKTWHDDAVTHRAYAATVARLGDDVCVVVAGPEAFRPALRLVGHGVE